MPDDDLLTVKQVADMFKVDERTVREWIRRGELIALDLGREYRIEQQALEDFKARRRTKRD